MPENIKASTGFEPVTSAIRPLRDTMCGFTAQLVEHRTGVGEVTGSDPLEALIFSGFFLPLAQIRKFTVTITLHFHLQLHISQYIYIIYYF